MKNTGKPEGTARATEAADGVEAERAGEEPTTATETEQSRTGAPDEPVSGPGEETAAAETSEPLAGVVTEGGGDAHGAAVTDGEGAPRTRPRRRRWLRRTALTITLVLLLPLLATQIALRLNYTGDPADGTYSRDRDAIWLGHAWVDGRKKDADITALAGRLRGTGIRDLYVHAGPLEHDGTLPKSAHRNAHWLIEAVHREIPGIRVQAWLGDVLATETPDGLHLERAKTRDAIVRSTREILTAGFDGVHFDLEPLHSGDQNYLTLLDALHRVTSAQNAPLSVAAHQIDPLPGFHSFFGALTGHPKWWSQEYFGEVARRVDQIAVMSYDTIQQFQSTYGGYVAQQTSLALEVTPPSTDLLMGLPFFHDNRFGHREAAETVPAAVRGVRLGLSRTDKDRPNFGVALYVDFAATEEDWKAYRDGWMR